ncbi:MAG: SprB repeat-containing protein [Sphingobacteriales bacterium]|nr:SprB repeat-containing protein [Sphingobacteriales bacterium]
MERQYLAQVRWLLRQRLLKCCNGGNNGSIDATVTGGTSPYTYLWSNGSTTEDINGLTAGNYGVTVTDANGCNITDTYLITEPSAIAITVDSSTPTTCNGAPTGSISISVRGGTWVHLLMERW